MLGKLCPTIGVSCTAMSIALLFSSKGRPALVMHGAPLLHGVEIYHGRPIFYDLGNFIYNVPPVLTYIHEPMSWESAVAYVQFEGKNLKSISFRPIVMNIIGEGQPDVHSEYTNNE